MTTPNPSDQRIELAAVRLVDTDPAELPAGAIVIGVYSQDPDASSPLLLASGSESIAVAFDGKLTDTLLLLGMSGAAGEVTKVATLGTVTAPLVAAVGLGPEPVGALPSSETLRRAAAAAVRALAGTETIALALPVGDEADGDNAADGDNDALRGVAEGATLGSYRFAGYKSTPPSPRRNPAREILIHVPDASDSTAVAEVERAKHVCVAVARTRDWVNAPANLLRPPGFADQAAALASAAGLEVEVLDEEQLRDGGYGGITAVGQGSEAPPRLVRIAYKPAGDHPTKKIALIGKGITFDTGGVSIKPAAGMWEMKSDMAGAAAVISTVLAAAAMKLDVEVIAYAPMAENMVSGSAYRPGDIVKMYNGKHVEVLNTDAEGRMVLGDAMARACEDNPDYLFETSTLTGGQLVALGKRVSGVMGDPDTCEMVKIAGDRVGEPAWPMPVPDDVRKSMDSDIADVLQVASGMDRAGHMLQGAAFLANFVTPDLPWAHIDIAGPSYHSGEATGYLTKGGTGVPIRTLLALIDQIAAA